MAGLQVKNFDKADETRDFPNGKVQIVDVDGFTLARVALEPGWRWSAHLKPIVGTESCQVHHNGTLIAGRINVRMEDGTEATYGPGDVYVIPPGHDAWVVGDEPAVGFEFAAAAVFAKPA